MAAKQVGQPANKQMSKIPFTLIQSFSETCLKATKADDIAVPLTRMLDDVGIFSWYAGSLLHENDLERGFGVFGMPLVWRKRYAEAHHCNVDPVFLHALTGKSALCWADCRERAKAAGASQRALGVFDEAAEIGLKSGFIMPALGFGGVPGAVTFGGTDPDLSAESQLSLRLVGAFAYEGFRRLAEKFKPIPPTLSPRELDVLRWTAEGKTAWEIGRILKIGERTVRTYQDQLKAKYSVSSVIQAAVRAALDGTLNFASMSTRYN
jgi:DNA-binding CsgD family transcriptional regulator